MGNTIITDKMHEFDKFCQSLGIERRLSKV